MYSRLRSVRNYFIKLGIVILVLLIYYLIYLLFPLLIAKYKIVPEEKVELYVVDLRKQINSYNSKDTEYLLFLKDGEDYRYTIYKNKYGEILAKVILPSGFMHYEQGVLYYYNKYEEQKVKCKLNINTSYIDNFVSELNMRVNKTVNELLPDLVKNWKYYNEINYSAESLTEIFTDIQMKNVSLSLVYNDDYYSYNLDGEDFNNFDEINFYIAYNRQVNHSIIELSNENEYVEVEDITQIPIECLETLKKEES